MYHTVWILVTAMYGWTDGRMGTVGESSLDEGWGWRCFVGGVWALENEYLWAGTAVAGGYVCGMDV